MEAAGDIQALREEATCPICLDYFADPVTIAECGHNFCGACLSRYWGKAEDEAAACPQCRQTVQQRAFIPNRQLKNVVEIAKKLSLRGQRGAGDAGVCEQHQEPLKLFCKDHQAPICVVCDRSKEHRKHQVIPLEEAFQEYKDQICSRLKILRAERHKILTYKADAEKESQDLLDIRRTLQRSKKKEALETSVAFPPELTCRIRVFRDVEALRESVMKQFQAANVTLDPDTAHPNLIVSEDRKTLRWGDKHQDLPNNPERFDFFPFVLACEGFATGTHFWNVGVENDGWVVGVARKSVRRKGQFDFSPKEGIWAVGKWRGQYKVIVAPDHIPLTLGQELKRIQVTLNFTEEQVVFSDPDTGVHLYTFAGASFCGETLLPLFHVFWKAQLRLSP